jgi:hypothetical protein
MFSATKFVVAGAIVALFGAFLLISLPLERPGEGVPGAATDGLGAFSPAGSLSEGRGDTATLLPDGRVFVVGSEFETGSAILWDPETEAFSPAGSLAKERVLHTASLLPDGRVLVVGGSNLGLARASAEVWDPETAAFSPAGSLSDGRHQHTATALPDGRVVVIGGWHQAGDRHDFRLPEVWDPATESFARAGSLVEARYGHTATLLSDGRVLVVGGVGPDGERTGSAVAWDPATASFSPAGSLAEARGEVLGCAWCLAGSGRHTATLLPDGRVLVVGGDGGDAGAVASAEVWDPATALFSPAGSLAEARFAHTATLLSDGRVLVVGGAGSFPPDSPSSAGHASAEVWDPATASFSPAGSLAEARYRGTATGLPDGRVLIVGGAFRDDNGSWHSSPDAEIWEPGAR